MNGRKWNGPTESSSFQRKIIESKTPLGTSSRASTSKRNDGSDSDPESLARITVDCSKKVIKRRANWETNIAAKKRRRKHHGRLSDDASDDELPNESSRSNVHSNPQILPGGSGRSVQNPLSVDSEILPNFPEQGRLQQNYEELMLSYPSLITDTSTSSNDSISFRNLEQSFQIIHETDHLPQNQPNPSDSSDERSRIKSTFKPSYVFRNLLYRINIDEAEEIAHEHRITNLPMDVLSEDQHILRDIRNVFESEDNLEDSTSQTETLNLQQTVDKDVFQKPSDQDNLYCFDWDKFLERWEGMHIDSESTSKVQHHEHKTIDKPEDCLPSKTSTKRKEKSARTSSQLIPFNGQAKKRRRIADSPKTAASTSFKSTSSNKEQSSNRNFVLSSYDSEMEMIVNPVPSDISETSTASKLEKFIKNTKIKLLEDSEMPPFTKKFIALDHESLPNRTNGSYIYSSKNQINVEENITGGTNNSTDKIEELTGVEGDDAGDTEMVS